MCSQHTNEHYACHWQLTISSLSSPFTHTHTQRERERDRQTSQVVNSQLSDQRSYRDNTANQSTSRDSTLQAREGRGEVTWFARRGAGMLWALSKRRHWQLDDCSSRHATSNKHRSIQFSLWCLTSLFSTNGYIRDERSGVDSYPYIPSIGWPAIYEPQPWSPFYRATAMLSAV